MCSDQPAGADGAPADAEVCNSCPALFVQQHIVWLEVPMYNDRVEVLQPRCDVQSNVKDLQHNSAPQRPKLGLDSSLQAMHNVKHVQCAVAGRPTQVSVSLARPGQYPKAFSYSIKCCSLHCCRPNFPLQALLVPWMTILGFITLCR